MQASAPRKIIKITPYPFKMHLRHKIIFLSILSILISSKGFASFWNVGPSRTYTLPSQIKTLVHDGDTIFIDGGIYSNDATKWVNKNLTFIGLGTGGNRTLLRYTGDIPNGKGIFVFETPGTCDNAILENIVFDGAQVSDGNGGNGAGIRFQANNLTINNCAFMNCQNGILEGNGAVNSSNVLIMNSEFYNNGYQLQNASLSGYEHHIYISASADILMVSNCWFHHPRGQANSLKTRAQRSFILYNLIDEESDGYGSWEINIAQGGLNVIMGNVIIQGAAGANHGIIGYDAATNALEDFYFVNNTVINQFSGNIKYFNLVPTTGINTFKIYNNIFASVSGAGRTMFSGNTPGILDTSNNINSPDYFALGFTNASSGDYRLSAGASSAIDRGTGAGLTNTAYVLTPTSMYQLFSLALLPRNIEGMAIDIGAFEFSAVTDVTNDYWLRDFSCYPNPSHGKFYFNYSGLGDPQNDILEIYNSAGKKIYRGSLKDGEGLSEIDPSAFPGGIYFATISTAKGIFRQKMMVQ